MTNILLGENSTPPPHHQQSPPEHMSGVEGTGQGMGHTGWLIHDIGKADAGSWLYLTPPASPCFSPPTTSLTHPRS